MCVHVVQSPPLALYSLRLTRLLVRTLQPFRDSSIRASTSDEASLNTSSFAMVQNPRMSDLPPHYSTHAHSSLQPTHLPLYTECPRATERRVLQSEPSSPVNPDPFNTRRLVYTADYFEVDLGQFPHAFPQAAYGFNGVVEGSVNFTKKCTHVSQVVVKVSPKSYGLFDN